MDRLDFEPPDTEAFPCLALAYDALHAGGTAPAVLNAANEVAVARFLEGDLGFLDIPRVIRAAMDALAVGANAPEAVPSYDDLKAADAEARRFARTLAGAQATQR
jgi:1-deoxy-D-xylulose-5-phosphate reductoisomerase